MGCGVHKVQGGMMKKLTREDVCRRFLEREPDNALVRNNCLFCIHGRGWPEYSQNRSEGKCAGCEWSNGATEKSNFKHYKNDE